MDELSNKTFQLIENANGYVKGNTVMKFNDSSDPNIASYTGPNVVIGQVIVSNGSMLYQALETSGNLCAGKANVTLRKESDNSKAEMILNWQWLTGDQSKGISRWISLNSI